MNDWLIYFIIIIVLLIISLIVRKLMKKDFHLEANKLLGLLGGKQIRITDITDIKKL